MKNKGKDKIYCIGCKQYTNHDIIASVSKEYTPGNFPEMMIDYASGKWEILMCCGCENVTFRETWITSEDYDPITDDYYPSIKMYPPREEDILQIKTYYAIPIIVQQLYREVIDSYNNDICTLCAAGIRALIECICVDKNVLIEQTKKQKNEFNEKIKEKSDLHGKIEGMVKRGLITRIHADILHELRFIGNKALHEFIRPDKNELKISIEILEHTFENIYEISNKAKIIRKNNKLKE
jgi:hypothetical protein